MMSPICRLTAALRRRRLSLCQTLVFVTAVGGAVWLIAEHVLSTPEGASDCVVATASVPVTCVPVGTKFHGIPNNVPYEGGPEGSCWCGHADGYCLCTPSLSVDVVIEISDDTTSSAASAQDDEVVETHHHHQKGLDLQALTHRIRTQLSKGDLSRAEAHFILGNIREHTPHSRAPASKIVNKGGIVVTNRTQPPYGVALPGGFVDIGESAEAAAVREVWEETGLVLDESQLLQSQMFSDPRRDPRRAGASMSFFVSSSVSPPQTTGDETSDVRVVPWDQVSALPFAFDDHRKIVEAAFERFRGSGVAAEPLQEGSDSR